MVVVYGTYLAQSMIKTIDQARAVNVHGRKLFTRMGFSQLHAPGINEAVVYVGKVVKTIDSIDPYAFDLNTLVAGSISFDEMLGIDLTIDGLPSELREIMPEPGWFILGKGTFS